MATKFREFRERLLVPLALSCLTLPLASIAAMMAENCAVKVEADAPPVAAAVAVDADIHLLVTNAGATAGIRVWPATPGWRLVEPSGGAGRLSVGSPVFYKVVEEADREATKSGWIRMFSADFVVVSDKPSGGDSLSGDLTDNQEATVSLLLSGISSLQGHSASMSVRPEHTAGGVNKAGTSVSVAVDTSSSKWRTTRVYWYGVNPDGCCYFMRFNYVFDLTVDGVRCASRKYDVGWPDENPRMEYNYPADNTACSISTAEYVQSNGLWRAKIVFGDFPAKKGVVKGCPTSDQYFVETEREENFHKMQWEGAVPVVQGGSGDCFTIRGMRWFAIRKFGMSADDYVYGVSPIAARISACNILRKAINEEIEESTRVDAQRLKFNEFHAKAYAGYNAAWKYHCCYQGSDTEDPTNVVHKAYQ